MKFIHAIIFTLSSSSLFSQGDLRYYKLDELASASVDSVLAIDLKKLKLTALPEEILRFKNITHLDLSRNSFSKVEGLEQFKMLRYLNLEKNKLDYFPVGICQLTEIEELILNRNYFESIPTCIAQCSKLKSIDLYYTAVTMLPTEMSTIKTLEFIDLTGVQINAKNQERIRGLFPNATVKLSSPCNCTQ